MMQTFSSHCIRRGMAGVPALASMLCVSATAQAQQAPRFEWPRSTLEAEGADARPVERLADRVRAGEFGNVDRLVVVRNGKLVVDERFERDYRTVSRGRTSGIGCGIDACADPSHVNQYNYLHPDFHPWWQGRDVHTLQSVTKSVTATLIGTALHRGEIRDLDAPLLSYFGGYDLSGVDARLSRATLKDLLTMRTGIEWHESDRPLDETNTTLQLERSSDWIRFTLAQPMDADPGAKWVYNSGGSQLMSEVIRHATGLHAHEYAERHLFGPLGIRDYHWKRTPTGHPDTEGGLYLEARDLARIGQLYLDDGVWQGTRLLPADWAREATARHVESINANPGAPGYGYQWWRYDRRGVDVWAGNGFGGQFLIVIPAARMVGVVNSWNVFGDRVPGILGPFIDAMIEASGVALIGSGLHHRVLLTYESGGAAQSPWVYDSVRVVARDGFPRCVLVARSGQTVRETCARGDTLHERQPSGQYAAVRPIGTGMSLAAPAANGRTLRYATGAAGTVEVSGRPVPYVVTEIVTVDAEGREVQRLREHYAPSLLTAVRGTFEQPQADGSWRVVREFSLVSIGAPAGSSR